MTYRPTDAAASWEAPAGLGPWREVSDEEFARMEATYEGDITRWYERVPDQAGEPPKRKRAAGPPEVTDHA